MEADNKRPNAALVNREWYLAAKSVLNAAQLGQLLVKSVEYVLAGGNDVRYDTFVEMAFAMVKPALDSDIAKYLERCARNAANAKSQRQRVAASGSESQQVGANTTTTSTPTTTPTTTTTSSISPEILEEKERWMIYGYFWSTGSKAIKDELTAFWSYYESLGWKNNKGAAIVSKLAAARMWKRQYETGNAPDGAEAWFKAVQTCPVPDFNIWQIFAGAERNGDIVIVRLRCSGEYLDKLKAAVPTLERDLRAIWRGLEVDLQPAG